MSPWKKISALCILVAPLGIFASACAVDATGAAEPASTAEADDAIRVDPAPLSPEADRDSDRGDRDGDRDRDHDRDHDIRRCMSRCYEQFFDCQRHFGGGGWGRDERGRCHRHFEECVEHCGHDH